MRGIDAEQMAKHHAIHLDEFAKRNELEGTFSGHQVMTPMHTIAYIIVKDTDMITARDALRPHRGEQIIEP